MVYTKGKKVSRQENCSVYVGHRYPLEPERAPPWAPSRVGLRSPHRKANIESLCVPRDQPEKEREGEGEREK